MVKQQFGEKYTVDERAFLFDTSNNSEPCIRIKYMRETPEQWTITKEGLSQVFIDYNSIMRSLYLASMQERF